jgi:hypothetical protein
MRQSTAHPAATSARNAPQRSEDRMFARLFAALVVGLIVMATFAVVSTNSQPGPQPLMSEAMPSGD